MDSHLKPLAKGFAVILFIAALLLIADRNNRRQTVSEKSGLSLPEASSEAMSRTDTNDPSERFKPQKILKLTLLQYSDSPLSEMSEEGIRDGLAQYGLEPERDYKLEVSNAQGDIATLNMMIDAALNDAPDLIFAISTPTLQSAAKKIKQIPIVFTVVADPILAGAGKSFTEHQANITGISTLGAYKEMIGVIKLFSPPVKSLGTLYSPGEANSVKNMNELKRYAEEAGLRLITVPINSSSEVSDAAMSLVSQNPDIVCQIVDNLTSASFAGIRKIIRSAKIPLFGFVSDQASKGAMVVVSRNYHQSGVDAVNQAVKIWKGIPPSQIPFEFVSKTDYLINPEEAAYCGMSLPEALTGRTDIVITKATEP